MNQPIEFVFWNYMTGSLRKFNFKKNINFALVDAKPWKKNQMSFFVNPTKFFGKPRMVICDIEKKCEVESLELTPYDAHMKKEVLVVNGEKDLVIFEETWHKREICLFSTHLKGITYTKKTSAEEPVVAVSQNKMCFV